MLLGVAEDAEQPVRVFLKDRRRRGFNPPVPKDETIDHFLFPAQQGRQLGEASRHNGHPLGQRVGQQEYRPSLRVVVPHERLGAPQNVVVAIAKLIRQLQLQPQRNGVARPVRQIMQGVAEP